MSPRPRALILRAAGTNCDAEMCRAFDLAGADPDLLHIQRLIDAPTLLANYDLLGLPGGFSYGDDIASGRVFATQLRERLYPALRDAATRGVPMIGACNGFQILTQIGLLPGPTAPASSSSDFSSPLVGEDVAKRQVRGSDVTWPTNPPPQTTALTDNANARFIDRWIKFDIPQNTRCIWTRPLLTANYTRDALMLPIAHGEGRFVTNNPATLNALEANGQIAARYAQGDNPNGAEADIAGICDPSGLIFGLMPHPERYLDWTNHPFWTRLHANTRAPERDTPGLAMFKSAVNHVLDRATMDTGRHGTAAPADPRNDAGRRGTTAPPDPRAQVAIAR